jgi:hypothetical protein
MSASIALQDQLAACHNGAARQPSNGQHATTWRGRARAPATPPAAAACRAPRPRSRRRRRRPAAAPAPAPSPRARGGPSRPARAGTGAWRPRRAAARTRAAWAARPARLPARPPPAPRRRSAPRAPARWAVRPGTRHAESLTTEPVAVMPATCRSAAVLVSLAHAVRLAQGHIMHPDPGGAPALVGN